METALVTGMLETKFLPVKQAKMDVKESNTESFSAILESSLKNNDVVESKDVRKTEENRVENKDNIGEDTKDVENVADENDVDEIKDESNKKDKKSKKDNVICQMPDVEIKKDDIKIEDVVDENKDVIKLVGSIKDGELSITPEDKLDNLLSKLDVKLTKNVEIKDDGESVIKVGPQSVETEKIKLNIEDVKNKLSENDLFVSKDFNNPEIQNPFKIKKSTDNIEINELAAEENNEIILNKDNLNLGLSEDVSNDELIKKDVDNKDVSESIELKNVFGQTEMSKDDLSSNTSGEKDTSKKEDKLKIRDFRTKKEVDFSEKFEIKEDIEMLEKFEIKEVNNIRNFENINFEQDVLDQVTEKLEVSLFDNKSEMVIKLKPADLGKITVKISIENGVMNAKFLADSIKVKETLESNLNNLKESLKEQGLNVQDLNVSVDSGRSQNQTFEQSNLRYFNNKEEYKSDNTINYEDTYYEFSNINTNNIKNYWMDSTVSFLA